MRKLFVNTIPMFPKKEKIKFIYPIIMDFTKLII